MLQHSPLEKLLAMPFEIDRRSNLSYSEFSERYPYKSTPVIVSDALRNWRALGHNLSMIDSLNTPEEQQSYRAYVEAIYELRRRERLEGPLK